MTLPPFDLSPVMLAARVAHALTRLHLLAYAQIAPDLTIVQASSNLQALIAVPVPQMEGCPLSELLWEFVGAEDALTAILRAKRTAFVLEQVNREQPDGSTAYFTFRVTPLEHDRPGAGLLLLIKDMTESSQLQQSLAHDRNELRLVLAQLNRANAELQRLNRFKSFMFAMAAHDLRSSLTTIHGYATLLLDDLSRGSPADPESAAAICAQADWLNQIITNLLNLDQIEQGRLVVHLISCDLNALVREVAATMQATAALGRLTLTLDLPEPPVPIRADPQRIRQILQNLIGNALKYTPEGGRVRVVVRQDAENAVLRVIDTGPGMSDDQLAYLFQPYYRTDAARKSEVVGTGLGLFIVKTLVETHYGRIEVTSRLGQGTTFSVYLPLTP